MATFTLEELHVESKKQWNRINRTRNQTWKTLIQALGADFTLPDGVTAFVAYNAVEFCVNTRAQLHQVFSMLPLKQMHRADGLESVQYHGSILEVPIVIKSYRVVCDYKEVPLKKPVTITSRSQRVNCRIAE